MILKRETIQRRHPQRQKENQYNQTQKTDVEKAPNESKVGCGTYAVLLVPERLFFDIVWD